MRWTLLIIILLMPAAMADEDARLTAFTEGRYIEAADLSDLDADADAHAFAARSLLAQAMSDETYVPPQSIVEQAERYARTAIELEPGHVEGRLQLAIAMSLRARALSLGEARRSRLGEDSKNLALSVLMDDPTNPYAHGFMAVWHIEVRRRGGSIGASILGASVKKGRKHYEAAIAAHPHDASIHWQYARALAALNAKKYRAEIDRALEAALGCGAETQLEALMQARARLLNQVIASESRKTVEALATKML